jgi:lipoprotein-releasing system permease protein
VNSSFFIARRYLFSKKTQNVINIISGVSVVGIMISTAAMVIILSGFNGIEGLVFKMFSSFESDIQISAQNSKTFDKAYILPQVYEMEGIDKYSHVIEEIAIVKNGDNFIIGTIKGVEQDFLEMSEMKEHLLDGKGIIEDDYGPLALIGGGAIENLDGYIYQIEGEYETFTLYSPNREEKISSNQLKNVDAFSTSQIPIAGVFSYNNDVDLNYLLVPLDFAASIFNYKDEITQLEIDFKPNTDLFAKKNELIQLLGPSFKVETNIEQNKLIFETSQSEKWITTLLLGFIFFLATFNMIASITMLVIEKRENMRTLFALGAKETQLRRIFFYEGLLINGLGLIFGLILGYGVCYLQIEFGLIAMDNSHVEFFPITFKWIDLFLILGITTVFGILAAYLPSRFLIKRIIQ